MTNSVTNRIYLCFIKGRTVERKESELRVVYTFESDFDSNFKTTYPTFEDWMKALVRNGEIITVTEKKRVEVSDEETFERMCS